MFDKKTKSKNIPETEKKSQNICHAKAINADFQFSHCKSMETLSCHSNEST